jgi:hypothetical protein
MRAPLALCLLCAAPLARAQSDAPVEIISPRADSVSITVYRDLFAMVTETRTVELPAGAVTLSFDGVIETLLPASSVANGLGDRKLEERNYDYDALAPANLLRRSIGKTVLLTRTLPGSGRVKQTAATVESANDDGVVLRTADGLEALQCSGLPEGLTFGEIPGDLHPLPRLSIRIAAGTPGKRVIKLSYLAQGFSWKSDYVAQLAADGRSMDLTGWVTLRNLTRASLRNAVVLVVAGRLNLIHDADGGTSSIGNTSDYGSEQELQAARDGRESEMLEEQDSVAEDLEFLWGCYPFGPPRPVLTPQRLQRAPVYAASPVYAEGAEEIIVTGFRASLKAPEMLADYHLYRIPWSTDLAAHQTKQVVFLQKKSVKTERFYSLQYSPGQASLDDPMRPEVVLGFENRKSSGLGEPLPAGTFRLFENEAGSPLFAGESIMGDKAVGVPVELRLADAVDLAVDLDSEDDEDHDDEEIITLRAHNAKPWPVLLELRQEPGDPEAPYRLLNASRRAGRKFGDWMWRLTVPANSIGELRYRIRHTDD